MVVSILVLSVFTYYIFELFSLQIINGQSYRDYADRTYTRTVSIDATRGEILDRNGLPLAENELNKSIVIDKVYMDKNGENDLIIKLIRLFISTGEEYNKHLPIIVDAFGSFSFIEDKEAEVAALKSYLGVGASTSANDCVYHLKNKYKIEDYTNIESLAIADVRYGMSLAGFSFTINYDFADDISIETISIITENQEDFAGARVNNVSVRTYPNGDLAPHVVGLTGAINQAEYANLKDKGYSINDIIGKSGIELSMEDYLRGEDGLKSVVSAVDGSVDSVNVLQEPKAGNTVYLTIDSDLQKAAYEGLALNIEQIQQQANGLVDSHHAADCTSGAVVVMDVNNFDVLAMASYPSYDLSSYAVDLQELSLNKDTPLVNRAINGVYPPGSTFKMTVAMAALMSENITPNTRITCNHYYTYYEGTPFQCLGWHGNIGIPTALQVSCNIFFYDIARITGITTLNTYSRLLGLGEKTGIELNESVGVLAGPEYRKSKGGVWYPGDTLQAAIGQSDNLFTPLQLCAYVATIANGGTRYETHVVKEVTNYDRTETVVKDKGENPVVLNKLDISDEDLKVVQYGMRLAMTSGSAAYDLGNYPIAVAGKTGTAQAGNGSDHGLLAVYAPYGENVEPEIAILVVLENGLHGYSATTTVKAVLNEYFYGDRETETDVIEVNN